VDRAEGADGDSPLDQAVAVVDRLVSPGGCPWDAEQTHRSLARFLLEETYEALDAIEADDPLLLREELGDVLFQVLFHARLGQDLPPAQRFSIDDVAADAVAKLTRRHPHVFGDATVSGADEVLVNWDQIKQLEKNRSSVTEGIPTAQPALALTAKLVERVTRAGIDVSLEASGGSSGGDGAGERADIGARLFALAAQATRAGIDPELALRATALRFAADVRQAEAAGGAAGAS
jgi:XTP/dITP diphosphohydrolase